MCLETIKEQFEPNSPTYQTIQVGYKVVEAFTSEDELAKREISIYAPYQTTRYFADRWNSASKERIDTSIDDREYLSGFHVFTKKEDAEELKRLRGFPAREVVLKVEYVETSAIGFQSYGDLSTEIAVAGKLFVSSSDIDEAYNEQISNR